MDGSSGFWGEFVRDGFMFNDVDEAGTPYRYRPSHNAVAEKLKGVTDSVVKFNVGGRLMATSQNTLSSLSEEGTLFTVLLNSSIPVLQDDDGNIFLDRDPNVFAAVIAYARAGMVGLKEYIHIEDDVLHTEFDYFMIPLPRLLASVLVKGFFVKEGDSLTILWVEEDPALSHTFRWISGVIFGTSFIRVEVRIPCVTNSVQFEFAPGRTAEVVLKEGKLICREVGNFRSWCRILRKWDPSRGLPPTENVFQGAWVTSSGHRSGFKMDLGPKKTLTFHSLGGSGDVSFSCVELCPFFYHLNLTSEYGGVGHLPKCMLLKLNSILLFEGSSWVNYKRVASVQPSIQT